MKKLSPKTLIITLIVAVYLFLFAGKFNLFSGIRKSQSAEIKYTARCTRVIDGDTIEAVFTGDNRFSEKKEKIRFVGVNTPELNINKKEGPEYWAKEAAAFTKKELEGHYIELSFDDVSDSKDKYGRLLCYVWIDNYLFNKILIESGNARYYPSYKFNSERMALFARAEDYAVNNRMGMWNE